MRSRGKLASWNDEKGYGFIDPVDGGKRVFVHIKAFSNRSRRPEAGQLLTYAKSTDEQGRPRAAKATLAGDFLPRKAKKPRGSASLVTAFVFLTAVGVAAYASKIPLAISITYPGVSLVTFIMYALDKSAARNGGWRTSESTLHFLALWGGWPGALIAQQTLRHKSRKKPFRVVFWITVLANLGMFAWTLTQSGERALRSLLAVAV